MRPRWDSFEDDPVPPSGFALRQNDPNPFRHTTTIRFRLPAPSRVRLEVFDLQGRLVVRLIEGLLSAGEHQVNWHRRDQRGAAVSRGVYLYRIEAGDYRAQRRLVILP